MKMRTSHITPLRYILAYEKWGNPREGSDKILARQWLPLLPHLRCKHV